MSKYFSLFEQTLAEVMQRQSNAALNRLQDQLSDLISLLCRTKDLSGNGQNTSPITFLKIQLMGLWVNFLDHVQII